MVTDTSGTGYRRALGDIAKGKISPVYLLYGEEEYLVAEALEEITAAIMPEADRELNLFVMSGGPDELERLSATLVLPPLLAGRKLVVVHDTHLFHSKQTAGALVRTMREQLEKNPARAVAAFLTFLDMTGWKLEDLQDDGWRTISGEAWNRLIGRDEKDDRETWLPRLVALSMDQGGNGRAIRGGREEYLAELLRSRIPPENHLILVAEAVDRRKKMFRFISEQGVVLHFPKVRTEQRQKERLMNQARKMLASCGKTLAGEAWETLGRKTGFQLRESIQAVEKLIVFVGDRKRISAEDVEAVVGKSREDSVFALVAAMTERNLAGSLRVFQDLLLQGVSPLMILGMISRELRNLLHAKLLLQSGGLSGYRFDMDYGEFQRKIQPVLKGLSLQGGGKEAGFVSQHPFAVYQSLKNSGRFTHERLINHLDHLVRVDILMKSTGQDERLLMERFLIGVCSGQ
ncbi:MAG: DNA polymerase III subunit delta [Syntrophales bacterium]